MLVHRTSPRARTEDDRPIRALLSNPGPRHAVRAGADHAVAGAALIQAFAIAVLLIFAAGAAGAEQVSVRSGAHPGFSRLVLPFARPVGWRLAPVSGGYSLVLSRTDVTLDLTGVFRLIPRTRLAAIRQTGPGRLGLDLACPCGVDAFWLDDPFRLVIDIRDNGARTDAQSGGRWPDDAGRAGMPAGVRTAPAAGPVAALVPRPRPATTATRSAPAALIPIAPHLVPLPAAAPAGADAPAAPPPATAGIGARPVMAGSPAAPEPTVHDQPAATGAAPRQAPTPAPAAFAPPAARARAGAAGPGADDPLAALRGALAHAIARGAAQGLLTPDVALPRPVAVAAPEPEDAAGPGPDARAGTAPTADGSIASAPAPGLRMETSVDSALAGARRPAAGTASSCRDTRAYNLPSWDLTGTPAAMIGTARAAALDATGTPRPEGVRRLVETYLYLGFGAEARAVLDRLGPVPDSRAYRDLAEIMDPQVANPSARLAGQLGCDAPVALWAALARSDPGGAGALELDAIVSAFAALPAHLRRRFGPDLASRLRGIGATEKAATVANATRRAVPAGARPGMIALMEARAALSAGARDKALAGLGRLVAQGGDAAPEATVLLIGTRLGAGEAPAPATVEAAHAFAREHRDRPLGARLGRAAILGDAALGRLDHAFRGFDALAPAARRDVAGDLFARLAADAGADSLLRHLVPRVDTGRMPPLGPEPTLSLAGRLIDAGFPDRAEALLESASPAPGTGDAARIRARLALARGDPEAALARLSGLDGPAAQGLRAEAAEAAGDLAMALRASLEAGETGRATRLAWRMGAWPQVAALASPARRALAESRLNGPPPPTIAGGAAPRLSTARGLIEASRERRALLARLLDAPAEGSR